MKTNTENSRSSFKRPIRLFFLSSIALFFGITIINTIFFSFINPGSTWLMILKHHQPKEQRGYTKIKHSWVSLDEISPNMVLAVIAAEDNKFMEHNGFDWKSIKKANKLNKSGKKLRGASTISQQTAKNIFLWPKRSWVRKGLEAYFTILIELFWSKERIMEVYLNVAEMGKGIYGAEAAAREYYKKPVSKITRYEAAMIATTLPAPSKRNPAKPSRYMVRYQGHILRNMNNLGKIEFKR